MNYCVSDEKKAGLNWEPVIMCHVILHWNPINFQMFGLVDIFATKILKAKLPLEYTESHLRRQRSQQILAIWLAIKDERIKAILVSTWESRI